MIIGLLAQRRNGKDTVADYLVKKYGFYKYSFADPFKEACKHMFMFTDEQCYGNLKEVVDPRWGVSPREIFMIFGTEISQYALMQYLPDMAKTVGNGGKNIWVHRFMLEAQQHPERNYVVADLRFHHEVNYLSAINGHIVKIKRPGFENEIQHASEAEIDTAYYDHLILNTSNLNTLYQKVDDEMKFLGLKKITFFDQVLNRIKKRA